MFQQLIPRHAFLYLLAATVLIALLACPEGLSAQLRDKALPSYYPMEFDGKGTIDRIGSDDIVINDIEYQLALRPVYNTPRRQGSSSYSFEEGSFVGYILNEDREIVSLWLINDYVDPRTD